MPRILFLFANSLKAAQSRQQWHALAKNYPKRAHMPQRCASAMRFCMFLLFPVNWGGRLANTRLAVAAAAGGGEGRKPQVSSGGLCGGGGGQQAGAKRAAGAKTKHCVICSGNGSDGKGAGH